MDEKKKEQIRKEAKQILEKFGKAIENVEMTKKDLKKEVGGFRKEGSGKKGGAEFRKKMFDNTSQKEGNYLIAEKKSW